MTNATTVYRGGNLLSIRFRFDDTRDVMMPANLAYPPATMVGLWHGGLQQATLVPSTATDAQVWPVVPPALGTRIHDMSDDNCPINTGWSYVGANHGYDTGCRIALVDHGKTTADVGSQWTDGTRIYTLLAVPDANKLLFGNPYTVVNGIAQGVKNPPSAPLTHVSGATHTATVPIAGILTPAVQIFPSTHSHTVAVELDGKPVPDGRSTGQALTISESYVIPSYQGMIDTARANIGTPLATIMAQTAPLCRVTNLYRWSEGTLIVSQRVTAQQTFTLNMGVTQCFPLTAPAGGTRRQFMPNVGVAGTLDWSGWADINTLPALTDFTPATLKDPLMPVSSMTQWAVDAQGTPQWGITMGMLPIGDGLAQNRIKYTTAKGWFISSSFKKNYPQLVWGRTLEAGVSVAGTAYRRYLPPPRTATEVVVSDGTHDFVMIERVGTVVSAQMRAPQLLNRKLVAVGSTNLQVPARVTADGIPYHVPVSPGYGMWRAEPDMVPAEALPGATRGVGTYFLLMSGPTRSNTYTGTYQRLLLYPMYLAEATRVDRACVEMTGIGTGVVRHGVYGHDPATGRPVTARPIADFGTVAAAVGVQESILAVPVVLPAGWHWYAHVWQAVLTTPPSLRASVTGSGATLNLGTSSAAMTGDRFGYHAGGVGGALGAITIAGVHQLPPPRVAYRRA
ncbi:hypothetical protein [Micromonospora sp. KLBMP9576]|uniref:hypothetical protein n=1 Tax=Micromonospora sp. KLBMP9576 TaxID=3424769 RepID=UPI003D8C3C1B